MVAIRPQRVQGSTGQKFVVTRRFSGDGHDFVIGDVIIAKSDWVHKVPQFVDQRFISPYLSEEDELKTPVNLDPPVEEEVKEIKDAKVTLKGGTVVTSKDAKVTLKENPSGIDDDEIDALAASLA